MHACAMLLMSYMLRPVQLDSATVCCCQANSAHSCTLAAANGIKAIEAPAAKKGKQQQQQEESDEDEVRAGQGG